MIEFKCRHCLTKYAVKGSLAGRTAECKSCRRRFMVPYASPVVMLGDEHVADDVDQAIPIEEDIEVAAEPVMTPSAVPSRPLRSFPQYGPSKKHVKAPFEEPLIPLPPIISQLWLPIGMIVVLLGAASYAVLDHVLQSDGRLGGLALIAVGVASLLTIAMRLTLRTLEGAAHTLDIHLSNAVFLQTVACVSLPTMSGVFGLIHGGVAGMALAAGLTSLFCPLLMTMLFQLPAGKGLQSGVLASIAFVVGYACSGLLVAAAANVMFTAWSVDLPWKIHVQTQPVAAIALAHTIPTASMPQSVPPTPFAAPPVTEATNLSPAIPASEALPAIASAGTGTVVPTVKQPNVRPVDVPHAPANAPQPSVGKPLNELAASVVPPARAEDFPSPTLRQAMGELYAGKHAEAAITAKAFQDRLPKQVGRLTDKAWIDSLHIQAVALLKLGQPAKAAPLLQRLIDSGITDSTIVINHAVCDIVQKTNAMRAVKNLKAYVGAHPDHELAVTLWGVALDIAATRHQFIRLDEHADDYLRANAILERTRPGKYHWGTRWIDAFEWNSIQKRRTSGLTHLNNAKRELREANIRLDRAQSDARKLNVVIIGQRLTTDEQRILASRQRFAAAHVDDCRRQVASAKASIEQAEEALPRPTWEMDVQPVDPELLSE
ncbi:MAG TPA: hypothetical protein VF595_09810 [Tepidisphaeraceae bacterium]|jgi:hypothetical protein